MILMIITVVVVVVVVRSGVNVLGTSQLRRCLGSIVILEIPLPLKGQECTHDSGGLLGPEFLSKHTGRGESGHLQ